MAEKAKFKCNMGWLHIVNILGKPNLLMLKMQCKNSF